MLNLTLITPESPQNVSFGQGLSVHLIYNRHCFLTTVLTVGDGVGVGVVSTGLLILIVEVGVTLGEAIGWLKVVLGVTEMVGVTAGVTLFDVVVGVTVGDNEGVG